MIVTVFSKVHEGYKDRCKNQKVKLKFKGKKENGHKINSVAFWHGKTKVGTATIDKEVEDGENTIGWMNLQKTKKCSIPNTSTPITKVKFNTNGKFKVSNMKLGVRAGDHKQSHDNKKSTKLSDFIHLKQH